MFTGQDMMCRVTAFWCLQVLTDLQDTVSEKQDTQGKVRVDGSGMKRETLFGNSSSPGSWLSESDVDFFTGGTN